MRAKPKSLMLSESTHEKLAKTSKDMGINVQDMGERMILEWIIEHRKEIEAERQRREKYLKG